MCIRWHNEEQPQGKKYLKINIGSILLNIKNKNNA